ncbi:MFS transporter [Rhodococcoides fascians]|uniref:MFS transporter n=1 Tax=Rhodococcoides fascians TaxID=1828 RepID=UPI001D2872D8|nr:MFS transporter [Rhodococcus fascians]CAH0131094.1 Inner membrane metabolite transport protein YhjE [Rhodococcus fascians]
MSSTREVREEDSDTDPPISARRTFLISGIGTALEYYDFLIYGLSAALVFNTVFFPSADPLLGTLLAFAAFGTGFIARPLGGIVIGHLGDRHGRRKMLVFTLIAMGVSTILIGCLPGYDTIGVWAPIALVALRLMQGFASGGEWGGAALLGLESSPPDRRGLWGSFTSMGVGLGGGIGILVFAAVSAIFGDALVDWAWRIPFLIGGVLVIVGLVARLSMPEETLTENAGGRPPIVRALQRSPRTVLLTLGISYGYNTIAYIGTSFFLAYLTQLGVPPTRALLISATTAATIVVAAPLAALLSDRFGRKPVMAGGGVLMAAFLFLFFWGVQREAILLSVVLFAVTGLVMGCIQGPLPAFLGEQFPASMRYSGISFSYQIGAAIGGGTATFIATGLLILTDRNPYSVALYGAAAMVVLVICVLSLKETSNLTTEQINAE